VALLIPSGIHKQYGIDLTGSFTQEKKKYWYMTVDHFRKYTIVKEFLNMLDTDKIWFTLKVLWQQEGNPQ
jgi:hypothetical protein